MRSNKAKNNIYKRPYASPSERRLALRRKRDSKARRVKMIAVLVIILLIILAVLNIVFGKNALNVKVGDTVVCTVSKGSVTAEDLKNTVQAIMIKELGTKIEIKDEITLKPVHVTRKKIVTAEYAVTQVKKAVSYNIEAGVIRVNGDKVLVLKNKDLADKLLNDILKAYIKDGQTVSDYKFKLDVQTSAEFVDSHDITSYNEAYKKLTQTTAKKLKYTVKSGDMLCGIASRYSMSLAEFFTANPELDENSVLHIGDTLNVTDQIPFLEVEYAGSAE